MGKMNVKQEKGLAPSASSTGSDHVHHHTHAHTGGDEAEKFFGQYIHTIITIFINYIRIILFYRNYFIFSFYKKKILKKIANSSPKKNKKNRKDSLRTTHTRKL